MRTDKRPSLYRILLSILLLPWLFLSQPALADMPTITRHPVIVTPDTLLDWPPDFPHRTPNLTEPTANRLNDIHAVIAQCDIVLSTAGNYHMALRELWPIYLSKYADGLDIKTWLYTTSPPISPEQVEHGLVQLGNLEVRCPPQVAAGPGAVIARLQAAGETDGAAVPIIRNYGNVILVRKGNPKHIKTIWDLGRNDVTVVTPNPDKEPGSFRNFSATIYNIAAQDPHPHPGMNAEDLFNRIFNAHQQGCPQSGRLCKWVSGKRIMHREIPWAIAAGKADAAVIFYHLALYLTRVFPDKFDIVPLGGTVDKPRPLPGNRVAVLQAVRIKGNWTPLQRAAQEKLMQALRSEDFTRILIQNGLRRP